MGRGSRKTGISSGNSAWTSNMAGLDERRAEPWSIAGPRLGASTGVTDLSKQYLSIHPDETSGLSGASPHQIWSAHRRLSPLPMPLPCC